MDSSELSSSLRHIVSSLHKGLRKQMSGINTYSMTEMETIGHLFRAASLLPTELAALTNIKTQSMSQIISKMEGQGIVRRTPSRSDKRKVYISLSPSGKRLVEKIKYQRDEWLKDVIDRSLSEKEKGLLIKALPALNKLVVNK
jgi:DNA-binding MarR family transcriptional regulator